jgi:hypothetical protein
MTLETLRSEYDRAKRLFEGCGCKVYKDQMIRLSAQIKALEASIKKA